MKHKTYRTEKSWLIYHHMYFDVIYDLFQNILHLLNKKINDNRPYW